MNNILILFIFMYFFMNKKGNINETKKSFIHVLEFGSLNTERTYEKIDILKKIGPYFPEWLVPILNKSILLTEKIVKLNELTEFLPKNSLHTPIKSKKSDDNKDRFNYIITTLKKEIPEERLNEMGLPMNLILNYEKYKLMLVLISQTLSNPQNMDDEDKLKQLTKTMFDGKDEKEKEKMKDMLKMLDILKVLDSKNNKDPKND